MAKKIDGYIKLQIPAGQANPSPPVGPALGQKGVNIMEFCKAFNADTQGVEPGLPIPVVITVYSDKSFTYIKKTPPASILLKKIAWDGSVFLRTGFCSVTVSSFAPLWPIVCPSRSCVAVGIATTFP